MIDEKLIEKLKNLSEEDKDDFSEELIVYVTEKDIQMSPQEKSAMFQFVKGHYSENIIPKVLDIVNRVDPDAINKLTSKYIKPKTEINAIKLKTTYEDITKSLRNRINKLSRAITTDLIDDLLSVMTRDELKNLNLTQKERSDVLQLIKGHHNPAALFNTLQVVTRALEEIKVTPTPVITRDINKEIRFGVELVPAMGLDKLVDYARKFEIGGIDNIWITDHYTNMDPYVTLTLIAKATSIAYLGVGVTNPYMRHLASTASTIASLDLVSNNRMKLGIGAGDRSTLASLNIETKSALTLIAETVEAIKQLWTEDNVNFSGRLIKLENARLNFKPNRNIPIYIGAQGPKMLKLAGNIGDGVLINASHELDLEIARKWVKEGVDSANKKIADFDLTAYTCFSINGDAKKARQATVPVVAFIAAATPQKILERHDLDVKKALNMRDYIAKGDMSKAFQLVNDSFIDAFSVSGTAQQCLNKIENLKSVGVTQFVFGSPLGPKKKDAISLITEKIVPSY
ncbi:MAG: 5,10-methylenetetrahydromethanopterin reductase [Candidatus Hodarchaeota archaeon]